MKLIDADEAFRILSAYYHHKTETQADALRDALDRVPEAVVRCRDCRYYVKPFSDSASAASQESAGADPERWCCRLGLVGVFENEDYCSYGERRTNEP